MYPQEVPVYEYVCPDCKRKYSALVGMTAEPDDTSCPNCKGSSAKRIVSRFARHRTEDDRVDELADELETMGDPDSPAEMRKMMREMGKALDEDVADELEEVFEADMEAE